VNAHHFAHYRVNECEGAVETALHRFAKAVLAYHKEIVLPPVRVRGVKKPVVGYEEYAYKRVGQEVPLKGFVADAVLYGWRKLVVELKVTHEVDNYKQRVFLRSGIQSVEIDVLAIFEELTGEGRAHDTLELARRIIRFGERERGMAVHGRWLFHPVQHNEEYRRRKEATLLQVRHSVYRDYHHYRTIGCPDPERRRFSGGENWTRAYARTHQDCAGCPHLVEMNYEFGWVGYKWLPLKVRGVSCGWKS